MARVVMHIDMDAFFAAIEQRDRPELRGQPVVVGALPGGRGVVSTCSYEARRFGIHSAMPINEAYRRCPRAHYLAPDFSRYSEASAGLMELLGQFSPVVEPVGIDEAYLDISGMGRLLGSPAEIGRAAKQAVRETLDLPMSVGIGPNRLIAKIGSDHDKPDGLTVVAPEDVLEFLAPLPVGVLRGVGKKLGAQVRAAGIRSVAELREWSLARLQSRFGEQSGAMLHRQARGQGSDRVGLETERKQISQERTFQHDVDDPEVLRSKLLELAGGIGHLARGKELRGRTVTLKIRFPGFETHTRRRTLEHATASDTRIFELAWELYQDSGFAGRPVRLIGVGLSGWQDDSEGQLALFDPRPAEEQEQAQLFQAIDRIKDRFGTRAIAFGPGRSQGRKPAGGRNRDDDR